MKVVKIRPDKSFHWQICKPEDVIGYLETDIGSRYEIEIAEMSEEEFKTLPESMGW